MLSNNHTRATGGGGRPVRPGAVEHAPWPRPLSYQELLPSVPQGCLLRWKGSTLDRLLQLREAAQEGVEQGVELLGLAGESKRGLPVTSGKSPPPISQSAQEQLGPRNEGGP